MADVPAGRAASIIAVCDGPLIPTGLLTPTQWLPSTAGLAPPLTTVAFVPTNLLVALTSPAYEPCEIEKPTR